jgi:iron-sulfur cluster assembly protein
MEEVKTIETTEAVPEVKLTARAISEVRKIMEENSIPDTFNLRVGVKGGGCSGLTYTLGFDGETKEGDKFFDFDGIRMMVDWKSILYLTGTTIDFTDGLSGKGFTFNNPTAKKTCGCGSSFGV